MGCTSCGQSVTPPCNACGNCTTCSSQSLVGCSSCVSTRTVGGGCCGSSSTIGTPYYQQARTCQEDNSRTIEVRTYAQTFKTGTNFCVPACGAHVRIYFPGIVDVAVGAWLWAPGIGFLQVEGFNPLSQEIELSNPCPTGLCGDQAAPGTPIPACTTFVLTVPPCSSTSGGSTSLYPFLASGFTAPANGMCIAVTVTNVNGLSVNKNISINNGIYRISAITSATLINICNDGAGLVPGTVVNYQDGAGNFIVPLVLIDSNPCLNTGALSGKMLVCASGVTTPLTGILNNQIPVLDLASGKVNFRTLGVPVLDCTSLTVCLTLDPALPDGTPYLVQVVDTSAFTPGEIVTIGGTQFTVDSIVNSTRLYLVPNVTPTAIQNYAVGSTLCSADCCTQLDVRTTALENSMYNNIGRCGDPAPNKFQFWNEVGNTSSLPIVPTTITAISPTFTGEIASVLIQPVSCERTIKVFYEVEASWFYNVVGSAGGGIDLIHLVNVIVTTDPLGVPLLVSGLHETHTFVAIGGVVAGFNKQDRAQTYVGTFTTPLGMNRYIRASVGLQWYAANGSITQVDISNMYARIAVTGVALS